MASCTAQSAALTRFPRTHMQLACCPTFLQLAPLKGSHSKQQIQASQPIQNQSSHLLVHFPSPPLNFTGTDQSVEALSQEPHLGFLYGCLGLEPLPLLTRFAPAGRWGPKRSQVPNPADTGLGISTSSLTTSPNTSPRTIFLKSPSVTKGNLFLKTQEIIQSHQPEVGHMLILQPIISPENAFTVTNLA